MTGGSASCSSRSNALGTTFHRPRLVLTFWTRMQDGPCGEYHTSLSLDEAYMYIVNMTSLTAMIFVHGYQDCIDFIACLFVDVD